jgi:CheY-like chemotaxis protein
VHVLLVEDNELNMEIAEFLLKKAGITVTTAYNGQEAVDVFRTKAAGTFDVILMDVMMPVMDGLTAAREIHATNRVGAAEIPIFAMTANAFYDDVRQSKEAGMVEHLSKPIQEQELLDAIRRHVKR